MSEKENVEQNLEKKLSTIQQEMNQIDENIVELKFNLEKTHMDLISNIDEEFTQKVNAFESEYNKIITASGNQSTK